VILGVLALLPPHPGVTKANYDRIQKGMTKAEVEEIFGEKGELNFLDEETLTFRMLYWKERDRSCAVIEFTGDCVVDKGWGDSDETILEKIRRWLHLP
jgi:hypothetical protein